MCRHEQQADRSMEDSEPGGKSTSTHMTGLRPKQKKIKLNKGNWFQTALALPRLGEHHGRRQKESRNRGDGGAVVKRSLLDIADAS